MTTFQVLKLHVLPGIDLLGPKASLEGEKVTLLGPVVFTKKAGFCVYHCSSKAYVEEGPLRACASIVYVIDKVLLPE